MSQTFHGKADIHMHTTCSDGLMTPEALVEFAAARTDLNVIAVTDHDTVEGGQIAQDYAQTFAADLRGLEVIVGTEVTSAEGEIIGLFMQRDVPKGLSAAETIDRIHAQGGLAIAAHPYAHILAWAGKSGMRGVGRLIETLPFDGVEVRNATPTEFSRIRGPSAVTSGARTCPSPAAATRTTCPRLAARTRTSPGRRRTTYAGPFKPGRRRPADAFTTPS